MNIAIVGYGSQGQSALEYWNNGENQITVCDQDTSLQLPNDAQSQLGENYLNDLDRFDLIVRSPSVHPSVLSGVSSEKITSNTNEFFRVCPTRNIIGVTGTKGKGTTSTLIAKMLEACGKTVHLGGNIGTPPLEMLKNDIQPDDWVVLELANFQLIDLKYSPHIAVCLMVEPEHQDWHKSVEEYYDAKSQLFAHQAIGDIAIYNAKNSDSRDIASKSNGKLVGYLDPDGAHITDGVIKIDGQNIISVEEIALPGKHNLENICAALTAVWQVEKNVQPINTTLKKFAGLPFRIEKRRTVNGITYYNDSFASAPGATIAAIETIPNKKVLIVGGKDRGLDLGELMNTIDKHRKSIRHIVLIGASAERVANELKTVDFAQSCISNEQDMGRIVGSASSHAETGDAVVLSPGFPSFDMFKNFEDRGVQFNNAVEKL